MGWFLLDHGGLKLLPGPVRILEGVSLLQVLKLYGGLGGTAGLLHDTEAQNLPRIAINFDRHAILDVGRIYGDAEDSAGRAGEGGRSCRGEGGGRAGEEGEDGELHWGTLGLSLERCRKVPGSTRASTDRWAQSRLFTVRNEPSSATSESQANSSSINHNTARVVFPTGKVLLLE